MMAQPLLQPRLSALNMARTILREDGPKGFYKGLAPVLLRAFPVNASALFVYEGLMRFMGAEKVGLVVLLYSRLLIINVLSKTRH